MTKTILWAIALVFTTNILTSHAVTLEEVGIKVGIRLEGQKLPPQREYDAKMRIIYFAEKYSVESKISLLIKIVECESSFNPNAVNLTEKEYSVGLVQINLWAHPTITKEQALDPDFAIEFLVKNVSEGRGYWWTCYQKYQ